MRKWKRIFFVWPGKQRSFRGTPRFLDSLNLTRAQLCLKETFSSNKIPRNQTSLIEILIGLIEIPGAQFWDSLSCISYSWKDFCIFKLLGIEMADQNQHQLYISNTEFGCKKNRVVSFYCLISIFYCYFLIELFK